MNASQWIGGTFAKPRSIDPSTRDPRGASARSDSSAMKFIKPADIQGWLQEYRRKSRRSEWTQARSLDGDAQSRAAEHEVVGTHVRSHRQLGAERERNRRTQHLSQSNEHGEHALAANGVIDGDA